MSEEDLKEELPKSPAWLVERAQQGDPEAFARLVEHTQARLRRAVVFWCYRVRCCENAEYADDILQDSLLKAYKHLGDFRSDANFSTWVTRIAINECLMMRRRRQKQDSITDSLDAPVETDEGPLPSDVPSQSESPEEECSRNEVAIAVQRAIQSLKEPYRTVLILRDLQGVSTKDAARLLGIGMPAVKTRLLRAREHLRSILAPDLGIAQGSDLRFLMVTRH
jgi:RNA polymerase sigma-70 factor (ECF subfamily)